MENKREWFIFYRSFWEAINELPKDNQLELYKAISDYSFTLEEPELTGLSKTIWILIKPQIEANNRRFINWSKAKTKQEESEWEANEKQNESRLEGKEKENEKEKEKDNAKGKEIYRKFKHLSLTTDEFNKLNETYTKESIDTTLDKVENYKNNKNYTSLYLTANNWLKKDWVKVTKKINFTDLL